MTSLCRGCDAELPEQKASGRRREWCSDRCRKVSLYSSRCIDCGAICNKDGRVTNPAIRCFQCSKDAQRTPEARRVKSRANTGRSDYTDADCFTAMRSVATDGVLTTTVYDAAYLAAPRGSMPSRPTLIFRFGSWATAVHAAGLRLGHEGRPAAYANRMPDDTLLLAIADCAAAVGHWPGSRTYKDWSTEHGAPSYQVFRWRFGSWLAALEFAQAEYGEVAA